MALPGGILNNPRWIAFDSDGEVLPNAKLYSYETGGSFSTPQALYSSSALTVALSNPVVSDSGGRFAAMFLLPTGYDLRLLDEDDNVIWTALNVEDIGQAFLSDLGATFADGARDVVSGYTVLSSDNLITVDSTGGADPCVINLQPASERGMPIGIKNLGTIALAVTPDGSEMIDGVAAAYAVPAASSPSFPTIWLWPDPDGTGYWIGASHEI